MLKSLERKTVAVHIVLCARACVCAFVWYNEKMWIIDKRDESPSQPNSSSGSRSQQQRYTLSFYQSYQFYTMFVNAIWGTFTPKKFRLTMCFIYKHTIQTTHTHTHTCRRKHTRVRVEVTFVWFKSFLSNMINQSQQLGCSSGYRPKWCNNTHHGMGNDSTLLKYQQLNNPFNAFSLWSLLIVFSIFRYAYTVNIYLFGLVFFLHSRIVFRVNIPDSAKRI